MTPILWAIVCTLISALLVAVGTSIGQNIERGRRVIEFETATDAMGKTILDLRKERVQYVESADKWRALYFAETEKAKFPLTAVAMGATSPVEVKHAGVEKLEDPPTVGQADRRIMEARRKEELIRRAPRTEDTMEPIPLMDSSVAPPPRLNDRG